MTAFSSLPVREVIGEPGEDDRGWPFTMGPVSQLLREGLELTELTVLVGENGVGKSTIIEAIAMAYGLSPEGGSTYVRPSERPTESPAPRTDPAGTWPVPLPLGILLARRDYARAVDVP